MEEEAGLCARCATGGPTCCQRTEILLTGGDIRRIGAAGGKDTFYHTRGARPDKDAPLDAVWAARQAPGREYPVLAHDARGSCVFLGPAGCTLAMDARPLVCRLYPYDYSPDGIKGVFASLCPPPERDNPALLLAFLAMNRDQAEAWRRQLYSELAEDMAAGEPNG